MSTASNERGLSLRSPGRFLATVDRLLELYKSSGRTDDSALRNQVADAWIGARAYQLNTFGTVTRLADGGQLGAESSINKVFWSEWDIATHETALELQGPEAELADNWMDGYLFSLSGPIYAGTNEIQKTSSLSVCSAYRRRTDEIRARLLPPGLRCKHRCTADQVRHARRHPFVERR